MHLTSVTLNGFKSFAKKTTLDVTHRVTGVVGPNGSGKSNVAEAIRFVLGEQSMKSMRGKLGADLIFKGSQQLPQSSKASVSMTINNARRDSLDTLHASTDLAPYLVYDELVLSRTIYGDGTSEYTINGSKVRLKDVQELLSFAGIGATAHTIISQGEADRILLASPKERKESLEDALGLRVYHMRLSESKRKLEKVKIHLHEVEALRKEVAPHLAHLQRQVAKLESREEERKKLCTYAQAYLYREEKEMRLLEDRINEAGTSASLSLVRTSLYKEVELLRAGFSSHKETHHAEKDRVQQEIHALLLRRDHVTKTLGRLEAEAAYLHKDIERHEESGQITVPAEAMERTGSDISQEVDSTLQAIDGGTVELAKEHVGNIQKISHEFFGAYASSRTENKDRSKHELARVMEAINEHEAQEKELSRTIVTLEEELELLVSRSQQAVVSEYEEEKKKILLEAKARELDSTILLRQQEEHELTLRQQRFEGLLNECVVIVGKEILHYQESTKDESCMSMPMYDLMRSIERSKLRIEEAGIPNAGEVIEEYRITKEREEYLEKEIRDIKDSEHKLLMLIDELFVTLHERFTKGVTKVSENFTQFFSEIFDGGKAQLSLVDIVKVNDDGEEVKEQGVDISVKLPSKKIQELAMFSGGERALVSIALLFAMSQVTPPPFMVLDETDAPLDEHNAKKYGSMLSRLAENSKLLVITHNRETMNHCDMLYGVTVGADGASKLLSIDFKQAEVLAQ